MLIPLGILAASSAAGGSYELIETITVGSGGAASVTFSNLNTYSSTYQHLQLRIANRSTITSNDNFSYLRFNGSTASSRFHNMVGNGSTVSSGGGSGSGLICNWHLGSPSSTDNMFGVSVIDILDPYEAKNKTIRDFSGRVASSYREVILSSAFWADTTSISSISLVSGGGNYVQGSRFSIYGLKGS